MASADDAIILGEHAQALGGYPHARRAGDFVYLCGTSCRRQDNTHEGVTIHEDGSTTLDIYVQTQAVMRNIQRILAAAELTLDHVIDVTSFLVSMDDFEGYNRAYNEFFQGPTGPTRTTLAVAALPHPNLLVELKVVAYAPQDR
ncbi:MAG: 2-aminomuconate deaminase [Bradymonadia bacterium]|jgi:2-aminomuconate deaminase